jgi:hypothetical protein
MKYLLSLLVLLSFQGNLFSQTEEVMKPINDLFLGMEKADTNLVKAAFTNDATMFTSYINKEGKDVVKKASLSHFIEAIGTKPKDAPKWIEKIFNPQIKVDAGIAQVWVDYTFYLDKELVHCGVNAFDLVRQDGVWKIHHIIDTRRKENCKTD